MSYQSIHFILFTAVVLLLYYLVGQKRQKYVLLLANICFFYISGIAHIPAILISTVCSFFAGRKMGAVYDAADEQLKTAQATAEKKQIRADSKAQAKRYLLFAMVVILGLLIASKITNLIIGSLNKTRAAADKISTFTLLGISYYTFMSISYMLDIYWRKTKAEPSFVSYAVFLSYFPHIVQGPIDRYKAVCPQINAGAKLSYKNITFGAQLAMWGFFKKMVVADRLNLFVSQVFGNYQSYAGSILLVAGMLSAFELYCNFSGCMDIVRGISQMFGIEIAKNFNSPFFSKSTAEFWRRWHITLGAWFRDYVYMPLSISSKVNRLAKRAKDKHGMRAYKIISTVIPSAIVWLLTGLWHGTGDNYVVWGAYWFVLTTLPSVFEPEIQKLTLSLRIKTDTQSWRIFQMVRTFLLFSIGRIISTSNTVSEAWMYLQKIVTDFQIGQLFDTSIYEIGLDKPNFQLVFILLLVLWSVEMMQKKGSVREQVAGYNILFRWILYYAVLFAIIIFGMYGPGYVASDFVYGNF